MFTRGLKKTPWFAHPKPGGAYDQRPHLWQLRDTNLAHGTLQLGPCESAGAKTFGVGLRDYRGDFMVSFHGGTKMNVMENCIDKGIYMGIIYKSLNLTLKKDGLAAKSRNLTLKN